MTKDNRLHIRTSEETEEQLAHIQFMSDLDKTKAVEKSIEHYYNYLKSVEAVRQANE